MQKIRDLQELSDKKNEGERRQAERAEAAKVARKARKHPVSEVVDERLLKMCQGNVDVHMSPRGEYNCSVRIENILCIWLQLLRLQVQMMTHPVDAAVMRTAKTKFLQQNRNVRQTCHEHLIEF